MLAVRMYVEYVVSFIQLLLGKLKVFFITDKKRPRANTSSKLDVREEYKTKLICIYERGYDSITLLFIYLFLQKLMIDSVSVLLYLYLF